MAAILILIPFYIFYFHFRKIIALPWSTENVETAIESYAVDFRDETKKEGFFRFWNAGSVIWY